MKLLKTLLALLLALFLVVGCTTPTTEDTPPEDDTTETEPDETDGEDETTGEQAPSDTLVVGTGGELNGHYYAGVTNSAYDKWVRNLLWDYGTYLSDEGGQFVLNETAFEEPEITENEDGSKTYTFTVKEGIKWSDGQPITAKDYVFGMLFDASPEWFAAGASLSSSSYSDLVGQSAYQKGETDVFEGVALVDENTFSATIAADKLPYFYELASVSIGASPMHRFSPNLDVDVNKLVVAEGHELSEEDIAAYVEGLEAQIGTLEETKAGYTTEIEGAEAALEEAIAKAEENGEEYDPTEDQAEIDGLKAALPAKEAKVDADVAYLRGNIAVAQEDSAAAVEEYTAYRDYQQTLLDAEQAKDEPKESTVAGLEATIAEMDEEIAAVEAGTKQLDAAKTILRGNAFEVFENFVENPDVTSGAYKFLVFENQSATVELNPEYAGDFRGNKPTIQRVQVRNVNEDLDVDLVLSGEIDIAPGVIEEEKIQKAEASDEAVLVSYPRNGYGVLAFKTAKEPVNHKEVRQAVAYLMDRQAIIDGTSGGYGVVGQGHYGLAQWMYTMKGEEFLDAVDERGTAYALNEDKANELLDQTPYIYEADGTTPWDAAKAAEKAAADGENFNYWRHDENGRVLEINQGGASAAVLNVIAGQMPATARLAGMKYTTQLIDFNILLTEYYNLGGIAPEDLTYHAFSLGTSFTAIYDPYYSYHSSMVGTGNNNTDTANPEADRLVTELRQISAQDPDAYAEKWLEWQLWYNENLPDIPLYSSEYFDITNKRLQGLETTPVWDWSMDIADLSLSE